MELQANISRRTALVELSALFPIILLVLYYVSLYVGPTTGLIMSVIVIGILLALMPRGVGYLISGKAQMRSSDSFKMGMLGIFNASYITILTWVVPIIHIYSITDQQLYTLLVIAWFVWGVLLISAGLLIRQDQCKDVERESMILKKTDSSSF